MRSMATSFRSARRAARYASGSLSAAAALLAGCHAPGSAAHSCLQRPSPPTELRQLDALAGSWETTGEVRLAVLDEPFQTRGSNRAEWTLDGRLLADYAALEMGPMGHVSGMSLWMFDSSIKRFRMSWFDSLGEVSEAIVRFDERTRTFHMRAVGAKYGFRTSGRCRLRVVDSDTLEWTWKDYDSLGLIKFADMHGISRRVPSPK